jgi:hypothetical protein
MFHGGGHGGGGHGGGHGGGGGGFRGGRGWGGGWGLPVYYDDSGYDEIETTYVDDGSTSDGGGPAITTITRHGRPPYGLVG